MAKDEKAQSDSAAKSEAKKSADATAETPMDTTSDLNESNVLLSVLNPHPTAMLLDRLSLKDIAKLALVNDEQFEWVRRYFDAQGGSLTIKINGNKFCLSRKPCDVANYSCEHRLIRQIDDFNAFVKMGLIRVHSLFVEAHGKPSAPRLIMHCYRKLLSSLSDLDYVYIDVNEETHYVEAMEELLNRSENTIQGFYVRRLDENTSKFNFLRFLNVTKFGKEGFPIRASYIKKSKKKKQKTANADNLLAQVNMPPGHFNLFDFIDGGEDEDDEE